MKTRNGFVSNSSSSSFIVGFKKKPTSDWELCEVLYPATKDGQRPGVSTHYGYEDLDKNGVDAHSASTIIWRDLEEQKPMSLKQVMEEIKSGYFDGYPDMPWNNLESDKIRREYEALSGKDIYDKDADPEWVKKYHAAEKKRWDEHTAAVDKAAREYYERVKAQFKGLKLFRFSYSDNDGSIFATMEHGDTFRNVPHVRISHH